MKQPFDHFPGGITVQAFSGGIPSDHGAVEQLADNGVLAGLDDRGEKGEMGFALRLGKAIRRWCGRFGRS